MGGGWWCRWLANGTNEKKRLGGDQIDAPCKTLGVMPYSSGLGYKALVLFSVF